MYKVIYKAAPERNGFIRGTLAPVRSRQRLRFGLVDAAILASLLVGLIIVMRWLLAH